MYNNNKLNSKHIIKIQIFDHVPLSTIWQRYDLLSGIWKLCPHITQSHTIFIDWSNGFKNKEKHRRFIRFHHNFSVENTQVLNISKCFKFFYLYYVRIWILYITTCFMWKPVLKLNILQGTNKKVLVFKCVPIISKTFQSE